LEDEVLDSPCSESCLEVIIDDIKQCVVFDGWGTKRDYSVDVRFDVWNNIPLAELVV
jgi:hypothetical protein